jgi:type IV secretory pathway TrbL component
VALSPDSGQILNTALNAFDSALAGYLPPLVTWGERMFDAVVFVGFGYAMIQAFTNRDWMGAIQSMGWAALRFCLIRVVFQNFILWSGALPAMGTIIGADVSGVSSTFGPSDVYALGGHIAHQLISATHLGEFFWHPFKISLLLPALIIVTKILWFASALVFMWVIIESKWIIAAGTVPIAFAGFEYTFIVLEHYFLTLLQVGIKLLVAFLVLAVGLILANGWIATLDAAGFGINSDQIGWGVTEFLEAAIFFFALWSLPRKAAALVRSSGSGGDPSSGGGAEAMWGGISGAVSATVTRAVNKGIRAVKG